MKKLFILIALMSMAGFASAQVGFNGVGGHLGYVSPEDIDGTIGFGAHADLGTLMPELGLFAYVDYWGKSEDHQGFKASFSVIDIAAIVKYHFSEGDLKPYAGGGLGLNIATAKVEWDDEFWGDGSESESETDISIHLLGGVAKQLSPNLDGFAEVKYSLSDIDWLSIQVGVTYKLK